MKPLIFIAFLIFFAQNTFAQAIKPFKKGDRIVFAGNSITEAGLYHNDLWLYYITRFPNQEITVLNGGIGGDVAKNINDRLAVDILGKKPTALVVTFGMNDSKYYEYGDRTKTAETRKIAVDTSLAYFQKIVATLKQHPRLRKIIMSSSLYDETVKNNDNYFPGKAATMEAMASFQQETAERNTWDFVDLMGQMTTITVREQAKNPEFTLTGPDRIHPGSAGHFAMAYLFLKAQGMAGKPVSVVHIDAQQSKITETQNARVSSLKASSNSVSYDYLAAALPFPIDTVPRVWQNWQTQAEALEVIPFMEEMNQESIKVMGLDGASDYELRLDNNLIGRFSSAQLAEGINLASLTNTSQYKQAEQLIHIMGEYRDLERKFRNYTWVNYNFLKEKGLLLDDSQKALDTVMANQDNVWLKSKTEDYKAVRNPASRKVLEKNMAAIRKQLYTLNRPKKIRVTLTAIQ
ncbi:MULTISPECIES: SGNH/GDSL hydrolase family protein [Sphingobacterium]|uniref:SGNH/GDSL hydrolase family protein n=1 Tax=Sphingobacterium populi TaxID=1812824 RepID=A0ABW5UA61_9SPHI|nr:SGNH/GDSL hydrolase family protein [Sphingobacterium sp. CFCC 11742]